VNCRGDCRFTNLPGRLAGFGLRGNVAFMDSELRDVPGREGDELPVAVEYVRDPGMAWPACTRPVVPRREDGFTFGTTLDGLHLFLWIGDNVYVDALSPLGVRMPASPHWPVRMGASGLPRIGT